MGNCAQWHLPVILALEGRHRGSEAECQLGHLLETFPQKKKFYGRKILTEV